ncbi:hypothetical protein [Granulicella arctica]|uniref:hypothetical protein n=1 Tax=Granulicella arctica TaxID=940613 RepID=UPI0021E0AAD4|nr:hypothetical protein [Granulicella arctica]
MNLSPQDRRNYSILAVFVLIAGYFLYSQLSTPDVPANAPAAPVVATSAPVTGAAAARKVPSTGNTVGVSSKAPLTTEAQLDPTLHMEAMLVTESLVYSGNGRNIFSANSAPTVAAAKLLAKVRTPDLIAPVRTGPVGPPPPAPIDLKFFGVETNSKGVKLAFLLHGEDVFLVSPGDIVQRKYRVISMDARSIVVEDIANSNRQTLPLQMN